ncbi:hypothetical protein [Clostridium saccharoperbutylacetonicum]
MNKLLIKTYAKKIFELLIFGREYRTPEYAYVRVNQNPKRNMYDDRFQR